MIHWLSIVQGLVLYVTVILGILLYVTVLSKFVDHNASNRQTIRNLTLWLIGVITIIFGVCSAHLLWPQVDELWMPLLGILVIGAGWLLYRLRRLTPREN